MKANKKSNEGAITGPLLQTLVERHKAELISAMRLPAAAPNPDASPDLYQDAGGGYNRNFVFPQD